ncbi:YolD-like family protein [Brevibacillus ruminantium]|uniref:YolD-like family protein n=1 Tax=Brevibacillus ruminantium TaxID=2950604 RepID=A0ABY4WLV7_9BACL|nr:YolD-like family protein [Brevibacillus ruminantium]USG66835.1 YolD-like family protein [Brevibacillus ruminantium]
MEKNFEASSDCLQRDRHNPGSATSGYMETVTSPLMAPQLAQRPVVDEDDFGEMCFRVYDSTQYDYAITVSWFREQADGLGIVETAWGVVRKIDPLTKQFKLVNDWEAHWIGVEDLVRVVKTKRADCQ